MDRFAVSVFPIAKLDDWRSEMESFTAGERAEAHRAFLRGLGVTREHAFHQASPAGDLLVLVHEGVSQDEIGGKMADFIQNPQSEHERHLATYVIPELHGVDPTAGPPPEMEKVATIEAG